MLRALDPASNYEKPKSKTLVPTKDELPKFSKNELAGIDKELEEDEKLRLARAIKTKQDTAIRDAVLKAGKEPKE